ncbi:hypothetical protein Hanom_Chr17g01535421 [Helianthus anomalus]
MPLFSSLKSTTSGRGRIRTYVEKLQQIYSLSLFTEIIVGTRVCVRNRVDLVLQTFGLRFD